MRKALIFVLSMLSCALFSFGVAACEEPPAVSSSTDSLSPSQESCAEEDSSSELPDDSSFDSSDQSASNDSSSESGDPDPDENALFFNTCSTEDGVSWCNGVRNATETFSFLEEIICSGETSYLLALDPNGNHVLEDKILPLAEGDNVAYVLEILREEVVRVHTVTIRRNPLYEVVFTSNGSDAVHIQYVEEGYCAEAPAVIPTREGNIFEGWMFDFADPIYEKTTIYAQWWEIYFTVVENAEYLYRVKVQSMNGFGFSGVSVELYDGATKVAAVTTDSDGVALFSDSHVATPGRYTVVFANLPAGYEFEHEGFVYETAAMHGLNFEIRLMPTGVILEEAPAGKVYKLGDVMYDFTLTRADGTKASLSEILSEKEMVLLNFWALRCGPCKREFPYMNEAYLSVYDVNTGEKYADKVEILAINNEDSQTNINTYKNNNGFAFEMVNNYGSGANITQYFDYNVIPISIIVDRYGVIVYGAAGSVTSVEQFYTLFHPFIGEDYTPTITGRWF